MDRPEFILGCDLKVFLFEVAETHHVPEQSMTVGTVVGILAVDACPHVDAIWQLFLNLNEFIFKPTALA